MTSSHTCTTCGLELDADAALEGLCPRCLIAVGAAEPRALESLIGRVLDGKYRVERLLGRGGMGAVFLATHLGTERLVALKILAPHLMDDEEFVERFRREARAAARLRHPNIVNVTDFGFAEVGGDGLLAYLVMEYLDGTSLADHVARDYERPLPWVGDVVEQIASAVDEAHRQGVIHRDLKPGNIWLVPDGRGGHVVKVLDFGLAKLRGAPTVDAGAAAAASDDAPTLALADARPVERARTFAAWMSGADPTRADPAHAALGAEPPSEVEGLTRVGTVLGTPLYMSPEQCRGEALDGRSDVYSLGLIAYELLTGHLPFKGSASELLAQHLERAPALLSDMNSKLPKSIDEVLMPALAKIPAERPATATALASSLKAALRTSVEKAETILSQAITIYASNLPRFLALSPLTGLMPFAVSVAVAALIYHGVLFGGLASAIAVVVVAWHVGNALSAGLTVPLVAHVLERPNDSGPEWRGLGRLARRFPAYVLATLWIRHPKYLIPHLMPGFALYYVLNFELVFTEILWLPVTCGAVVVVMQGASVLSSVALLEGHGIGATSKREIALSKRLEQVFSFSQFSSETLLGALVAGSVALGTMVVAAWVGFYGGVIVSSDEFAFVCFCVAAGASLALNPILAISSALRYLKARRLGGESLDDLLAPGAAVHTAADPYEWLSPLDAPSVRLEPKLSRVIVVALVAFGVFAAIAALAHTVTDWLFVLLPIAIWLVARIYWTRFGLVVTDELISQPRLAFGRRTIQWDDVLAIHEEGQKITLYPTYDEGLTFRPAEYERSADVKAYIVHQVRRHRARNLLR